MELHLLRSRRWNFPHDSIHFTCKTEQKRPMLPPAVAASGLLFILSGLCVPFAFRPISVRSTAACMADFIRESLFRILMLSQRFS